MTLTEIIAALQHNREHATQALHLIEHLRKERTWLLDRLDEIRTEEYNRKGKDNNERETT